MRPIQKPISSLPDHFGIGVKMASKNIFFTLSFWVELPQILGLGFSVCVVLRRYDKSRDVIALSSLGLSGQVASDIITHQQTRIEMK